MNTTAAIPTATCDCHMHIYDDAYSLAPTATFKPPHAPAAAYRELQRQLGLRRVVVVQPTGYGFDNRCTLTGLEQLGPEARATVVVPPDEPDAELQRLDRAGVRGVRYMMLPGGVLPWSGLERTAATGATAGSNSRRPTRARAAVRPTTPTWRRWRAGWPRCIPSDASGPATGRIPTSTPDPPTWRCSTGRSSASATRRTRGARSWSTTPPNSTDSERDRSGLSQHHVEAHPHQRRQALPGAEKLSFVEP